MPVIATQTDFFADYVKRCFANDGYVVMKSMVQFKVGERFDRAASSILGATQDLPMMVLRVSSADEAKRQAWRYAGIALGQRDLSAPFYYRIGKHKLRVS